MVMDRVRRRWRGSERPGPLPSTAPDVPLVGWDGYIDHLGLAAAEADRARPAFDALVTARPERLAFWSDEIIWLMGSHGLDAALADTMSARSEASAPVRVRLRSPGRTPSSATGGPGVLLASSPRSGNTIVRRTLAESGLAEHAVHDLADIDWAAMTTPWIVQHHAGPQPAIDAFLAATGAAVLVVVRHPLDVLCSVRRFAAKAPSARFWIGARTGLESADLATDAGFVDWATGPGADALLAVNTDWSTAPGVVSVRHEDVHDDPARTFAVLFRQLARTVPDLDGAAAAHEAAAASIPAFHRTAPGPGARHELPDTVRRRLAEHHRWHLDVLGYDA